MKLQIANSLRRKVLVKLAACLLICQTVSPNITASVEFEGDLAGTAEQIQEQTLRMTFYRGPGTTDRDLGPKVCDGDPESEWVASGLTRTNLGPPFEFILETLDGQQRDFAGVHILSASAAEGRRLNGFEIRVESEPGSGNFDRLVYLGQQTKEKRPQSHLFEQSVRTHRFQWILRTNHGDRNEFRLNELWPIFDAAQTAQASFGEINTELASIPVEKLNPEDTSKYLYQALNVSPVPKIPGLKNLQPIDAWILKDLLARGLNFQPEANPAELIRRLSFNLTGLPPTPELINRFVSNPDDRTYAEIVENLLNQPAYGENQARHWLDVVRYADTDGYAADGVRPEAWRYRDYVIRAFNHDKPYDRFLTEQLAADELEDAGPDALPALGMARLGPFRTNSGNQNLERNRQELMTEMVSNVSLTFLGLTIGCARCHDHKIDPIPQADYYRFSAYFAATEPAMLPLATELEQKKYREASDSIRKAMEPKEARMAAIRGQAAERLREQRKQKLDQATIQALEKPYEKRTDAEVALIRVVELELEPTEKEISEALNEDEKKSIAAEQEALNKLKKQRPAPLPLAWGLKDSGRLAPVTFLLHRGQIEQKSGIVQPRAPSAFASSGKSIPSMPDPTIKTTGRRRKLAEWMTGAGQAQVARVLVNRVWQQHFGRGIVGTTNNFGDLGDDPTHPELLDWLASDFIRNGWSLKDLNRKIVLSQAFRQSSKADHLTLEKDPVNQFFSRQNRRRLAAEEIRDGILLVSGTLNTEHQGGPPVVPPLPPEVLQRLKTAWRPTNKPEAYLARSIYLQVDRNLVLPILEEFDRPDSMTSCSRRNQSTHALQSLAMMNHPWIIQQARVLGQQASQSADFTPESKLSQLYSKITGRSPNSATLHSLQRAYKRTQDVHQQEEHAQSSPEVEIWTDMALLLINSNDWFYLD